MDQQETLNSVMRRVKSSEVPQFKQREATSKTTDTRNVSKLFLTMHATDFLKQLKETLQKGKTLVVHGWDFVQEYLGDDLAKNAEDAKKIKKALKSVNKMRESKQKEKSINFFLALLEIMLFTRM